MQYRIDFFELIVKPTANVPDAFTAMTALAAAPPAATELSGYMRELWQVSATAVVARGQFRKFRMGDLPEVGRIGSEAQQLALAEDQGIIEKNFFTLHRAHSLLVWHANGHANTPSQFARLLTNIMGTEVEAVPLIHADALKRLMKGNIEMRSLDLSIPRPQNPDYYPKEEFSQHLFNALGATDGDRIRVSVTTNATINSTPRLGTKIKKALKELVTDRAVSTARVGAIEDGFEHPIDLIADRLSSPQEVEHEGRYPAASAMFGALDNAFDEQKDAIDAILGSATRHID